MAQFISVYNSQASPEEMARQGVTELGVTDLQLTAPQASDRTIATIQQLEEQLPGAVFSVGVDVAGRHQVTVHLPAARRIVNEADAYTVVRPDGQHLYVGPGVSPEEWHG